MTLAPDPIVVLGAPRSGTTYLHAILDSHPEVVMTNEVRLLEWLHRALVQAEDDRALMAQREAFVAFLHRELPELVRRYYENLAPRAHWWGDKNPHYAESEATLQTIVTLFPGARFLHIVRDPRAVVASLLRKRDDAGKPWSGAEDGHVLVGTHLATAHRFGTRLDPRQYHQFRYEDLVADDEGVARALFAWLEIPFAAEVERFCRQQMTQRTSFSGPTSDLAKAGSRASALADWQALIPADQQRRGLLFLAPFLLQFGYETRESLDACYRALPAGSE